MSRSIHSIGIFLQIGVATVFSADCNSLLCLFYIGPGGHRFDALFFYFFYLFLVDYFYLFLFRAGMSLVCTSTKLDRGQQITNKNKNILKILCRLTALFYHAFFFRNGSFSKRSQRGSETAF